MPAMPIIAGYIRESSEDSDRDPEEQKAGQREDIRAMAAREGHDPGTIVWYDDWGRSGSGDGRKARPALRDLWARIETGEVAAVYTRALARLGRNVPTLLAFIETAERHGTRIVTGDLGVIDRTSPAQSFTFTIMAASAQMYSDEGKVRARHSVATKRRNGQYIGRKPYGQEPGDNLPAVMAAWEQAGSFGGAARILNASGVPTRLGRTWDSQTVSRIVRREDPRVPERNPRERTALRGTRLYSGLLVCPKCEGIMSSMTRKTASVGYYCRAAHLGKHPGPYVVAETKITPFVQERVADLWRQVDTPRRRTDAGKIAKRRETLIAKRERTVDMYADGVIDKAERDRRLATIRADLDALVTAEDLTYSLRRDKYLPLPPQPVVNLAGDPAEANTILRQMFARIVLDHTLRPVHVVPTAALADMVAASAATQEPDHA